MLEASGKQEMYGGTMFRMRWVSHRMTTYSAGLITTPTQRYLHAKVRLSDAHTRSGAVGFQHD